MEELTLLFAKHSEWVSMVERFGCNRETAEDITQEMYIKIKRKVDSGADIMFNEEEVNYYFVFKVLRNLFLDLKRKERMEFISIDDVHIECEKGVDYVINYQTLQDELSTFHWYDQKIFDLIESGESISGLHRKTNISYYSLYNTYKKVKKHLLKKLNLL